MVAFCATVLDADVNDSTPASLGPGAGVGEGVGVEPEAVTARGALHALVPEAFAAFTNQLYVVPLASAVAGVTEHVPVPAPQFAPVAVYMMLTSTPAVFCTSSV